MWKPKIGWSPPPQTVSMEKWEMRAHIDLEFRISEHEPVIMHAISSLSLSCSYCFVHYKSQTGLQASWENTYSHPYLGILYYIKDVCRHLWLYSGVQRIKDAFIWLIMCLYLKMKWWENRRENIEEMHALDRKHTSQQCTAVQWFRCL